MALAHTLGFPRIGRDRELKKAQEAFWKGELDEAGSCAPPIGRYRRTPASSCCRSAISPGMTRC